jgi:hypothetical protein
VKSCYSGKGEKRRLVKEQFSRCAGLSVVANCSCGNRNVICSAVDSLSLPSDGAINLKAANVKT